MKLLPVVIALVLAAHPLLAQDAVPPALDPAVVKQAVDDYLKGLNSAAAPTPAEQAILNPGQPPAPAPGHAAAAPAPTPLAATWDNQMTFTSPDKDFRVRLGGRFQFQSVYFQQADRLQGKAPGNGGIPASKAGEGVGAFDDGSFFRRVRVRADGTAYGNVEFVSEVNFEQLNYITYDHMWAGLKDVPYLGTVRVGQHKVPQGLEMMASDYHLTFLQDRSVLSEAIWTLFGQGVFLANNYLDQHVSAQFMAHRIQPTGFYTSDFGDGNYAATGRVTGTPLYEDDGRYLVHLGASYQFRTGDLGRTIQPGATGNAFADTQAVARFRARSELRDATGIGAGGNLGGNPARLVDTGFLLADSVQTVSPEVLVNWGPFAVQAEAAFSKVQNAASVYPAARFGTDRGDPLFWGGYVETSYFLTGENRGYDRRFGVFDRAKVRKRLAVGKAGEECEECACGAWQIAYRYSYLDLNDNGIAGGQLTQQSVGLNWYLTDNLKVQFMYNHAARDVAPARSGTVQGFGTLVQWYY